MNGLNVELTDVTVAYTRRSKDPVVALDGVSLALLPGEVLAVVGRSGSGKSTLASVFALMRAPDAGRVMIDGADLTLATEQARAIARRDIGLVFQGFHVDLRSTLLWNVQFPFYWRERGQFRARRDHAMEALQAMGIGDLFDRHASDVSGGERQRVAIARALAAQPRLLVADEPTGNLDESTADLVLTDLYRAAKERGTTVVMVTHDPHAAAGADTTIEMKGGRIVGGATT